MSRDEPERPADQNGKKTKEHWRIFKEIRSFVRKERFLARLWHAQIYNVDERRGNKVVPREWGQAGARSLPRGKKKA